MIEMIISKSSMCNDWKYLGSQLTHRKEILNIGLVRSLNIKEQKVHVQNTSSNLPVSLELTQVTKRL